MAAGLRQRVRRDVQARASKQPSADGLLQAEVGTRGVAYGGETALQHAFQDGPGHRGDQRRRLCGQAPEIMREVTIQSARVSEYFGLERHVALESVIAQHLLTKAMNRGDRCLIKRGDGKPNASQQHLIGHAARAQAGH